MNRIKCNRCNLVNSAEEIICRRCGQEIRFGNKPGKTSRGPREAAKRSSWFYTIVALLLFCSAAAYVYSGIEKSFEDVNATDWNRVATQPRLPPEPANRTEADQKRTGTFKTAIQNSPGLTASEKHNEDMKKLMPPEPEKSPK